MNFANFFKQLTNDESIVIEADQKTLFASSMKYIANKVENEQGYCTWGDVYKFLGQEHKVNNANITNPIKPILI